MACILELGLKSNITDGKQTGWGGGGGGELFAFYALAFRCLARFCFERTWWAK